MVTLAILSWFTSRKEFLGLYKDSEAARNIAIRFWESAEQTEIPAVVLMLIVSAVICWIYYFPFNNMPGRHYKPSYMFAFMGVSTVAVFILSFLLFLCLVDNSQFNEGFLAKLSAVNVLYSFVVFFIVAIIICKSGKSNAYPII